MNILVIEDQAMIAEMLAQACGQTIPGSAVDIARTGAAGIERCRCSPPDFIFLDLGLPDMDGLEMVPDLFAAAPAVKIVVLSAFTDEFTVHRAIREKVHAFLDKNEQPLGILAEAIREVKAGRFYFSPETQRIRASLRADPMAFNKLLSDREQEMLGLFGRGLSNEELAARYGLSVHTAKIHRRNIMGKLGLHSTPHLIHYAVQHGFTRSGRVAGPFSRSAPSA